AEGAGGGRASCDHRSPSLLGGNALILARPIGGTRPSGPLPDPPPRRGSEDHKSAVVLGQLSEFLGYASDVGEHDRRVADRVAPESGSYRIDRPIHGPAGRAGGGAGPVAVIAEAERQFELEGGFLDQMGHRDGQQ